MPNGISPKKDLHNFISEKQKAFLKLSIPEAYDMAKIFNGPGQNEQRTVQSLCESFLNLNFKKRPTPSFAVSISITESCLFLTC